MSSLTSARSDYTSRGQDLILRAKQAGKGHFATMTVDGKVYYVVNIGEGGKFYPINPIEQQKVEALAQTLFAAHKALPSGASLEDVDYIDSEGFHYKDGKKTTHDAASLEGLSSGAKALRQKAFAMQQTWETTYESAGSEESKKKIVAQAKEEITKEIGELGISSSLTALSPALNEKDLKTLLKGTNEEIERHLTARHVWTALKGQIIPPEIVMIPQVSDLNSSSSSDDEQSSSINGKKKASSSLRTRNQKKKNRFLRRNHYSSSDQSIDTFKLGHRSKEDLDSLSSSSSDEATSLLQHSTSYSSRRRVSLYKEEKAQRYHKLLEAAKATDISKIKSRYDLDKNACYTAAKAIQEKKLGKLKKAELNAIKYFIETSKEDQSKYPHRSQNNVRFNELVNSLKNWGMPYKVL
ncbi:hypothetical protein [Candidatus Neptunochlamydia vexilliferae]|uniref:Uncharacterized protein n=1 Tax=Candidatus Neptunichlamydia vexilliferae TaxID=1651774 RepID=A0ABS0AZR7_9BACT|nr:hypothetical protein [Candidatus Neptunochlamydia vexilliferae]MBF5059627.1 hypothetical protein [Candidatus Neptunochlamydia vexilliferae]